MGHLAKVISAPDDVIAYLDSTAPRLSQHVDRAELTRRLGRRGKKGKKSITENVLRTLDVYSAMNEIEQKQAVWLPHKKQFLQAAHAATNLVKKLEQLRGASSWFEPAFHTFDAERRALADLTQSAQELERVLVGYADVFHVGRGARSKISLKFAVKNLALDWRRCGKRVNASVKSGGFVEFLCWLFEKAKSVNRPQERQALATSLRGIVEKI